MTPLATSIAVFSLLFFVTARFESSVLQWKFKEWYNLSDAAWYTFGTFIGEAITRDTKSEKSK